MFDKETRVGLEFGKWPDARSGGGPAFWTAAVLGRF